MASSKPVGTQCVMHGAHSPDEGTTCRSVSPSPGVLGRITADWMGLKSYETKILVAVEAFTARIFRPDKAAAYLLEEAQPVPKGLCARYCTAAVTAGFGVQVSEITSWLGTKGASTRYAEMLVSRLGLQKINVPDSAKDYGFQVLSPLGFTVVAQLAADSSRTSIELPDGYAAQVGDIIIYPSNGSADNKDGHMQVFTGGEKKQWVSDGFQKTILPNSDLNKGWQKVGFSVYRFKLSDLLFKPSVSR